MLNNYLTEIDLNEHLPGDILILFVTKLFKYTLFLLRKSKNSEDRNVRIFYTEFIVLVKLVNG